MSIIMHNKMIAIVMTIFLLSTSSSSCSTLAFMVDSNNNARLCPATTLQMSSIGGGSEDNPNSSNNGDSDDDNPLNEWIQRRDTENVRRYREQFSEGRLPISYGAINDENESTGRFGALSQDTSSHNNENDDAIDATSSSTSNDSSTGGLSRSKEPNPYLNVVSRLAPSDLISKFTSSASPRVQDAVRTTVLGLIGGLPQMAFETKTIATGERL